MKGWLEHKTQYLGSDDSGSSVIEVFARVFYAAMALFTLWQLPIASEIYGATLAPRYPFNEGILSPIAHFLDIHPDFYQTFMLLKLLACCILIFRRSFLFAMIAWLCHLNLFNSGFLFLNSGDMVMNLFFAFLVIYNYRPKSPWAINLSLSLVQVQVCLIYAVGLLYKLQGTAWMDGSALTALSENDTFTTGYMTLLPEGLLPIITWIIVGHQLFFPALIWFKKFKLPLLMTGVLIHLGISLFMGLVEFGIIMSIAYLAFITKAQTQSRLFNWILPGK